MRTDNSKAKTDFSSEYDCVLSHAENPMRVIGARSEAKSKAIVRLVNKVLKGIPASKKKVGETGLFVATEYEGQRLPKSLAEFIASSLTEFLAGEAEEQTVWHKRTAVRLRWSSGGLSDAAGSSTASAAANAARDTSPSSYKDTVPHRVDSRRVTDEAAEFGKRFTEASVSIAKEFEAWLLELEGKRFAVEHAKEVIDAINKATRRAGLELILDSQPVRLTCSADPKSQHAKIRAYTLYQAPQKTLLARVYFPKLSVRPIS